MEMRYYNAIKDFGEVYRLFTNKDINYLITCRPYHNDTISFEKWINTELTKNINDFMVFYEDNTFLGFAYTYEFNALDRHSRITVAVKPEYVSSGVGCLIAINFLEYLFKTYTLRKVYMNVYDFNNNSINAISSLGLQEETRLKEYHYYDNKYCDLVIFSISKKQYELLLRKYLKGGEQNV